jgi:hypothetical protein
MLAYSWHYFLPQLLVTLVIDDCSASSLNSTPACVDGPEQSVCRCVSWRRSTRTAAGEAAEQSGRQTGRQAARAAAELPHQPSLAMLSHSSSSSTPSSFAAAMPKMLMRRKKDHGRRRGSEESSNNLQSNTFYARVQDVM